MYKILEDCKYSEMCQYIEVKKGDIINLPEFVATSWLKRGICELAKKKKSANPVEKTAVVDPVKETKAKKKKK